MASPKVNIAMLTSYELIHWLDETNPHRSIGRTEDYLAAHRRGAIRELIDNLLKRIDREENGKRHIEITV